MGLFSSKKKTYVTSSVWNLAGDETKSARVLPTLVLNAVLGQNASASIGQNIVKSLRGPTGTRMMDYFRWSRSSYVHGTVTGAFESEISAAGVDVQAFMRTILTLDADQDVEIVSVKIDRADLAYWAETFMAQNRPLLTFEDWDVDYEGVTDTVSITTTSETLSMPTPEDYMWAAANGSRRLAYIAYYIRTQQLSGLWSKGPQQIHTYRMGSGGSEDLDDLLEEVGTPDPEFLPSIPLRQDNVSVRSKPEGEFASVKKAFKRYTNGGKIEQVLDLIEDHEKVGDMDHVFVHPGIPLNTKNQAGLSYLFRFFQRLRLSTASEWDAKVKSEYEAYVVSVGQAAAAKDRWETANGMVRGSAQNPTYGAPLPPALGAFDFGKTHELRMLMPSLPMVDMRLRWKGIEESIHLGNAARFDGVQREPLKKGQYRIQQLPDRQYGSLTSGGNSGIFRSVSSADVLTNTAIFHQFDSLRYRRIDVWGLHHVNMVYGGQSVTIGSGEALADEDDTGFLVPLHYPTLRRMSLAKTSELANCSAFVVINSYQIVKVKWYQRGIFKILFVIVSIVVSAFSGGAGLGAAAGLLGTNATVGLALGMSGMLGAIAGAVVNAIAAMVLSNVLMKASVAILGDKLGAVIGTLVSFVAMQLGPQLIATGSLNFDWGAFMRIDNLTKITNAVTGAYSTYLNMDTLEIQQEMRELGQDYKEKLEEVRKKSDDILGVTSTYFDPMILTDAGEYFNETRTQFLGRTLLTGSDLAELTHTLIEGFVDISLELPNAFE